MKPHEHADGINHEELSAPVSGALPESEVEDLLDELAGIMEADDSVDSDGSDDEYDPYSPPYEREVTIHFPEEAGHLFGKTYATVPIRDVLTWMAEKYPRDGKLLTAIRDGFYCGDYEDDYGYQLDSGIVYLLESEELAEIRHKHKQQLILSKERSAVLQKEWLDSFSSDEKPVAPVESEKLVRARKLASSAYRSLEAAWDEFVKKPTAERDPKERELLLQREERLRDLDAECDRLANLQ